MFAVSVRKGKKKQTVVLKYATLSGKKKYELGELNNTGSLESLEYSSKHGSHYWEGQPFSERLKKFAIQAKGLRCQMDKGDVKWTRKPLAYRGLFACVLRTG